MEVLKFWYAVTNFVLFVTEIFLLKNNGNNIVDNIITLGSVLFPSLWSLIFLIIAIFKDKHFGKGLLFFLFIFSWMGVVIVCGVYHETFQFINLGISTLFTILYLVLTCRKSAPESEKVELLEVPVISYSTGKKVSVSKVENL